jgi:hypothetical protein
MKQETNNEMDLLLRRLGRRDETAVSGVNHLDADELSAYAENALPPMAHARYTAHLADCSQCRELVVQLSASAGVVVATESAKAAGPSGWKKFLATLFTPMVLRYAAPALGLIVVAAIGFVILRSNQPAHDVAQVTNTEQHPAAAPPTPGSDANTIYSYGKPGPSPEAPREKQQARGLQADSNSAQNAAPVVSSVDTQASKDAAAAQPKQEQQTATANEPPPPPKVSATPTPEESPRREAEVTSKEVRELPVTTPSAGKTLGRAEYREDRDKDAKARKPATVATAQGTGSGNMQADGVDMSASTRTVAGRRFRKQGGVWIDTAYDSSKNVVTVTRNSEQYRGLVGDEPAIKTIADTLDGEIIVVWKGRTYRIH